MPRLIAVPLVVLLLACGGAQKVAGVGEVEANDKDCSAAMSRLQSKYGTPTVTGSYRSATYNKVEWSWPPPEGAMSHTATFEWGQGITGCNVSDNFAG